MRSFIKPRHFRNAFSLVEVVVAVGIFAISIVAVIGLLGPTNKSVADVRDTDDASRVVSAIQAQLQTMAGTSTGWTSLAGTNGSGGFLRLATDVQADDANASFNPGSTTYTLFASRDGARIGISGDTGTLWQGANPSGVTSNNFDGLKYFEITLIRNETLSPATATNDNAAGFLAYTIRLRWPAYLANGQRFTDNTQKNVLLVPGAVHR